MQGHPRGGGAAAAHGGRAARRADRQAEGLHAQPRLQRSWTRGRVGVVTRRNDSFVENRAVNHKKLAIVVERIYDLKVAHFLDPTALSSSALGSAFSFGPARECNRILFSRFD